MEGFDRILTDAEAAEQARDDYCRFAGKVVLASGLYVREDGDIGFKDLKEPALFRITSHTAEADIVRWTDGGVIDPVYGVRLLRPHPELGDGCVPLWVDGPSVAVNACRDEPRERFEVADPATQALYAAIRGIVFGPEPTPAPVPGR